MDNGRRSPDTPLPPSLGKREPQAGSWISIGLATVAALVICGGLFVLMLQFGGPLAIVAVLVFGLGGLVALFHYLVWGWWLGRTIRDEVEAEERAEKLQE